MKTNILTISGTANDKGLIINDRLQFGQTRIIQKDNEIYLVIGVQKNHLTLEEIRSLGGKCRKEIKDLSCHTVQFDVEDLIKQCTTFSIEQVICSFIEGWLLADYQFLTYKKHTTQEEIAFQFAEPAYEPYVPKAKVRANAVNLARDLCNEPANKLTPAIYANRLKEIFQGTDVKVDIIDSDQLREKGFEAVATVGEGSGHPPKLAVLTLERDQTKRKVALIGKGVTFDSGGINAKTASDIGEMKMDMGGSAAVVGAMKLLADSSLATNTVAILPLVVNVADGNAFLPSDVITYRNGLTVEVGNTDAEGRLVLADGILYAQTLGSETIIDIATLTGTIGQALGLKVAGIFSNHEDDLWEYRKLGENIGDYVWPMPVIDDYEYYLQSNCADINNMSSSRFGGSITAALFLKQFIETNKKWIHIDMANTVRPWKEEGYYVSGASGFGVRLLTEIVCKETKGE